MTRISFFAALLLTVPVLSRRRDAGVLADSSGAGRSGAGDARRERVAAGRRRAPRPARARSAALRAVRHVPDRARARRPRTSLRTNQPVTAAIAERMPATFELALAAMAVAVAVRHSARHPRGGPRRHARRSRRDDAGAGRASRCRTSGSDRCSRSSFRSTLGWLPVSGRGTLAHLVLPAITLGAPLAAVLARMTRASVIEELRELYVLAARARGRVARARGPAATRFATA